MPLRLLAILFFMPCMVQAQDSMSVHSFKEHRRKNQALVIPAIAAGYSGLTYLIYKHADGPIRNWVQKNKTPVGDFISSAITDIGLGKTQAVLWAGTTAFAFILKDDQLKKTVIVWAGTLLVNSELTTFTKMQFQRYRPNEGHGSSAFEWKKGNGEHRSFVSGHTSNVFATATVFATVYKDVKWVPWAAYGVAGLVGLSRIYDDAHWTSDVMAGAAIGFGSAKLVELIYRKAGKKLKFLPGLSPDGVAVRVVF